MVSVSVKLRIYRFLKSSLLPSQLSLVTSVCKNEMSDNTVGKLL